MRSVLTPRFRRAYEVLPTDLKVLARVAYRRWRTDPQHPGLGYKRVHSARPIYSVRVGIHYRAPALVQDDTTLWLWIGSHAEYDEILRRL